MLLSLCQKHLREMTIDITKYISHFYENISRAMKNKGYKFKPNQCHTRIQTLHKRYKRIKEHNKQTGEHNDWEYYDLIEELLGATSPPASSSTLSRIPNFLNENEFQNIKHETTSEVQQWLEVSKEDVKEGLDFDTENSRDGTSCLTLSSENEPQNIKCEIGEPPGNEMLKSLETSREDDRKESYLFEILGRFHEEDTKKLTSVTSETGSALPCVSKSPIHNTKREVDHSPTSEILRCLDTLKKENDEEESHNLEIIEKRRAENTELLQALTNVLQ